MRISLVATVRNEADNIAALLDSMLAQTLSPHEIVINDNGSTDGTRQIIEQYIRAGHTIRLTYGYGNISTGRNRAIRHSHGDIIACCDAGLTLPPEWLAAIVTPILQNETDVVGGFTEPVAHSLWELALGATTYPEVSDIDAATYLPGARSVAFRRMAWECAGGFPEWADTGEDLIFDKVLKASGFRFLFVPTAVVYFRPRATPQAFYHQYYAYARGDGVGNLWPVRHAIRYSAYLGVVLTFFAAQHGSPLLWLWLIPGVIVHTYRPYQRLRGRMQRLRLTQRLFVLLLVPIIRLIGDFAKMIGYPTGILHRLWNTDIRVSRAIYLSRYKDNLQLVGTEAGDAT